MNRMEMKKKKKNPSKFVGFMNVVFRGKHPYSKRRNVSHVSLSFQHQKPGKEQQMKPTVSRRKEATTFRAEMSEKGKKKTKASS